MQASSQVTLNYVIICLNYPVCNVIDTHFHQTQAPKNSIFLTSTRKAKSLCDFFLEKAHKIGILSPLQREQVFVSLARQKCFCSLSVLIFSQILMWMPGRSFKLTAGFCLSLNKSVSHSISSWWEFLETQGNQYAVLIVFVGFNPIFYPRLLGGSNW